MALLNRYLLDTNILIHYARGKELGAWIESRYGLQSSPIPPLISQVSVGELHSFALQGSWGEKKMKDLQRILDSCVVVPLDTEGIVQAYAKIDFFSQKSPNLFTARNMGKNDLWIAATAHIANVTLLACDHDFDHLHPDWLTLEYVDPESVKKASFLKQHANIPQTEI